MESAHIYTCRCELIFILTCAGKSAEPVFQNLLTRNVKKAHTLCVNT